MCKGNYTADYKNTGYIKIASSIDGIVQEREHIIQVIVKEKNLIKDNFNLKIFDGKSEEISLFKYEWREWDKPFSSGIISERSGTGNGKVEIGEIFSIWIQTPVAFDSLDVNTWHPTIPIKREDNPDIIVVDIKQHRYNTGRPVLSAQMKLTRKPTKDHPVRISLQTEFLKVHYLENECHRNTTYKFRYSFSEFVLYKDGTMAVGD